MTDLLTSHVELNVADGTTMRAYVARPKDQAPRAGLLVFQEAFGVNGHIRDVTARFARQGFSAIAPELFHRTAPGFEGSYTDFNSVAPHIGALKSETMAADIQAAFTYLEADAPTAGKPIAGVGFCMGGMVSFLAATEVNVKAAISFYGGGIAPNPRSGGLLDRTAKLRAPVLLFWGGKDKHIGPEKQNQVAESLRAAGKSFVNVEFSEADHGFFCDQRASYNPQAAGEAWALSLEFLKTHLGT
ncbi:MAG: dienelactone hydrolase family protein [Candidatus Acidiferrales bacterium]